MKQGIIYTNQQKLIHCCFHSHCHDRVITVLYIDKKLPS